MRYRPTEVRALVELLDKEHEDVTELAKAVISTLDGLRADRSGWYLNWPRLGTHLLFGPFASLGTAQRAVERTQWDSLAQVGYAVIYPAEAMSDPDIIEYMRKGETGEGDNGGTPTPVPAGETGPTEG